MTILKTIRELLLTLVLLIVVAIALVAVFAPTTYGKWLQKIDTGRFEMLDCDCTAEIAE